MSAHSKNGFLSDKGNRYPIQNLGRMAYRNSMCQIFYGYMKASRENGLSRPEAIENFRTSFDLDRDEWNDNRALMIWGRMLKEDIVDRKITNGEATKAD